MADETTENEAQDAPEEAEATTEEGAEEAAPEKDEQKIMCFVSKQMVPISQTVEIEYAPRKKVRVLPKYIKFDHDEADAS